MRELYCFDHGQVFGPSRFAGTLCSRATLRTDVPVVLALAGAQADDEDDRLGLGADHPDDRLPRRTDRLAPPAGRRSRPLSTGTHVCPEAG
ncbi:MULTISPECIES: hypothetical protein [Streptomyces]|uniref:hypothetical protein n=1 Tax=Streptomyces TaxID=1883 RepID=UPI0021A676FB|nr:hypothetical protein [Streptomyces atratus]MCT2545012.1 hypothetical protein [Streptomyces atratus]